MSKCTVEGNRIIPCKDLKEVVTEINADVKDIGPGFIGMVSYVNHTHVPNADVVFAVSTIDNMPKMFTTCPFCGESIKTMEK